jgi:cob(I)alamin adenosyltransferase
MHFRLSAYALSAAPLYSRAMKIYTRRGDTGETDLLGAARVAKDHPRVEAYGAVDELNAALGACATASGHADLRASLARIQGWLFDLGAYLASPDEKRREKGRVPEPRDADVAEMEKAIDTLEQELAPLARFILPGGTPAAAAFHVARTVCRRAERCAVALHHEQPLAEAALRLLNRLSDLLFVMARVENRRAGVADVEWPGRGD